MCVVSAVHVPSRRTFVARPEAKCLTGMLRGRDGAQQEVWSFKPGADTWTQRPPMLCQNCWGAAWSFRGELLLIGGAHRSLSLSLSLSLSPPSLLPSPPPPSLAPAPSCLSLPNPVPNPLLFTRTLCHFLRTVCACRDNSAGSYLFDSRMFTLKSVAP